LAAGAALTSRSSGHLSLRRSFPKPAVRAMPGIFEGRMSDVWTKPTSTSSSLNVCFAVVNGV